MITISLWLSRSIPTIQFESLGRTIRQRVSQSKVRGGGLNCFNEPENQYKGSSNLFPVSMSKDSGGEIVDDDQNQTLEV